MTAPPISMRTCAVVWPFFTSTILPLMMLRALSFMLTSCWRLGATPGALLTFRSRAGEQCVEFGLAHIHLIEDAIEVARHIAEIAGKLAREKQPRQPFQADPPVERGRRVDPTVRKPRADENAAAAHGVDRSPCGIRANMLCHGRIDGHDRVRIPSQHLFQRHRDE